MLGDAALAAKAAEALLAKGVYVIGFSYPVVPQGKARIRVQISAAHTRTRPNNQSGLRWKSRLLIYSGVGWAGPRHTLPPNVVT
jgi:hypothetical protein